MAKIREIKIWYKFKLDVNVWFSHQYGKSFITKLFDETYYGGDVCKEAKKFVEDRVAAEKRPSFEIERAKDILADRRNHTIAQVEDAEALLNSIEIKENNEELPF